jgi:PEP-CTERM motif-containing protein
MTSGRVTLKRAPSAFLFAAAVLGAVTLSDPAARADITETIDFPNAALSGFAGPYATVVIKAIDAMHATITFTSLTTNGTTFLMGDGGTVDLNVNGAYNTIMLTDVTETNSLVGFTPSLKEKPPSGSGIADNAPGQVDSVGIFNLSLNNNDGYGSSADSITINITNTTGLWTSDAAVLVNNAGGFNAAIHAFACTAVCDPNVAALNTGFAANRAPEPTSLALLATGLAGIGAFARRRRRG